MGVVLDNDYTVRARWFDTSVPIDKKKAGKYEVLVRKEATKEERRSTCIC